MEIKSLLIIAIGAIFIHNFVLHRFLGLCPFLGVSKKIDSALGMGMAVIFVMTMASTVTYLIQKYLLIPLRIEFLQTIAFILVIATLVQLVEMIIQKFSPGLYSALGIYLPLITTNCAILGLALFMIIRNYDFVPSVVFGFSSGLGFSLVLIMMAGIREELKFSDLPEVFKGAAITLITAGILAMAFMGFSGLISS